MRRGKETPPIAPNALQYDRASGPPQPRFLAQRKARSQSGRLRRANFAVSVARSCGAVGLPTPSRFGFDFILEANFPCPLSMPSYQRPQFFQRVAEQVAPVLPLPQGVANHLARRSVFAGRDRVVDHRRQFRREGNAALSTWPMALLLRRLVQRYDLIAPH